MRTLLSIVLLSVLIVSGCKKDDYLPEGHQSFDTQYKIFRVKVKSESGTPYSVNIKRGKLQGGVNQTFANMDANQSTGLDFEYGFTPAVGEIVTVVVKSHKDDIKPYAFYKGEHSFPLEMKQTADGYTGTLTYQVEE